MLNLLIADNMSTVISNIKKQIPFEKYSITKIKATTNLSDFDDIPEHFIPDIIIADIDFFKYYNNMFKNTNAKYILLSSDYSYAKVRQAFLDGVVDFILKPIDYQQLEYAVSRASAKLLEDFKFLEVDPITKKTYNSLSPITRRTIKLIHSKYNEKISLKHIAELFKINSNYLGRVFLNDMNIKFSDYLMIYRMEVALHLIKKTKIKIADIADNVGYQYINHFYKDFHNYHCISPMEIRDLNLDEADSTFPVNTNI